MCFSKVEHVIKEQNVLDANQFIELICELIALRLCITTKKRILTTSLETWSSCAARRILKPIHNRTLNKELVTEAEPCISLTVSGDNWVVQKDGREDTDTLVL